MKFLEWLHEKEQNDYWHDEMGRLYRCDYYDISLETDRHFWFRATVNPEERARRILAEKGINSYIRLEVVPDEE